MKCSHSKAKTIVDFYLSSSNPAGLKKIGVRCKRCKQWVMGKFKKEISK